MSSKRDSGIGRSMLASLGSPNGKGNHSRQPSGTSTRESVDKALAPNGSLNGIALLFVRRELTGVVSDRLEAVLARTDELDAANVAHLAQSISELRGKSHGLHGIHPGMLATDISPPGSSQSRSPTQQGTFPSKTPHSNFQILYIFRLQRWLEREKSRHIRKLK
jgi:hypothetical protein